jgi:two-component system cell cycle sensor histidine kinase/response regulator CckA
LPGCWQDTLAECHPPYQPRGSGARVFRRVESPCTFVAVSQLILVVEDEPQVARVTCQQLVEAGFSCMSAGTASDAMSMVSAERLPDLLLLDVRLPDLPGPELALRIHARYPRVPVLFVSGWIDGLTDAAHLEPLRWDFVPKPFTGEALVAAVRRLLESSAN